jgi:uncharacterized protein
MRSKLVNHSPKTYLLVFDIGDDLAAGITDFATKEGVNFGYLTGIGACSYVTLGYFDFATKDYKKIPVEEQVEGLSLTGNITLFENKPKLHAHLVVGKKGGTAFGGHLLKALVNPTFEVLLTVLPGALSREIDDTLGIPLIKL